MSAPSIPFPPQFTENTWTATSPKRSTVLFRLPVSLSRLFSLLEESGEDDYGQIGPSQFAFKTACLMVVSATALLDEDIQDIPCAPVVDSEGGIRITWTRYNKQIKLVCPSTKDAQVYIYQSSPAGTSLRDQNVTASVLADRLSWLNTRESAAAE
jgi:hypothetical protein